MPMINVKLMENVFTSEQKGELAAKVTDAVLSVEGEYLRDATFVIIEEVKSGDWAIGGRPVTTEAVRAMKRSAEG